MINRGRQQLDAWLSNSWRQLSLLLLSLLFGYFMGGAVATIAGQAARWDTTVAFMVLVFTEIISRVTYRSRVNREDHWWLAMAMANNFKIGITYSLFLEALKLGS